MRLKLLYNPAAGRGKTRRHVHEVMTHLRDLGANVHAEASESPEHMSQLAEEASNDSWDRVLVCGGDGTMNLALRRFNLRESVFAAIPLGSGDDFAQTMGIPRDTRRACETAVHGSIREVDVAVANGVRYLGVAGLGFDSEVAAEAMKGKVLRGPLIYLYSIFRVLPRFRPLSVSVRIDGVEQQEEIMFAAIGNTHRYGAGIKIVPTAVPDDGMLDLCLVRKCSLWNLLTTLPKAYTGAHVKSPFVAMMRAKEFGFSSARPLRVFADGEEIGSTPVEIDLLPDRLRVVVPQPGA